MTPSETPEQRRARVAAERERKLAAQETADDMTTDLRSVYGTGGAPPSMFSRSGSKLNFGKNKGS